MENFGYFIFMLVVLVVGVILVKKVTGCLIKSIIAIVVLAILVFVYLHFFYN